MKAICALLLALLCPIHAEKPWPGVEYMEVRAYAWPASIRSEEVILPGMKLGPGVQNKEGQLLDADQVKRVIAAVNGKHPAMPMAGCYLPHNAFIFYDGARKPVAYLEICFTCMRVRREPAGGAGAVDLFGLAKIFTEKELPLGRYNDAESFRLDYEKFRRAPQK